MEEKNLSPEVINYGTDCREQGYRDGYLQATLDHRKRRFFKEKGIRKLSDKYCDHIDDKIAQNKRK